MRRMPRRASVREAWTGELQESSGLNAASLANWLRRKGRGRPLNEAGKGIRAPRSLDFFDQGASRVLSRLTLQLRAVSWRQEEVDEAGEDLR
jgi:hypothetical protein